MPFFWVISIFMVIFFVVIMLFMYNVIISYFYFKFVNTHDIKGFFVKW